MCCAWGISCSYLVRRLWFSFFWQMKNPTRMRALFSLRPGGSHLATISLFHWNGVSFQARAIGWCLVRAVWEPFCWSYWSIVQVKPQNLSIVQEKPRNCLVETCRMVWEWETTRPRLRWCSCWSLCPNVVPLNVTHIFLNTFWFVAISNGKLVLEPEPVNHIALTTSFSQILSTWV